MFERLIEHFASAPTETLAAATLEDVALLTALRASYAADPESASTLDFVSTLTEAWLSANRESGERSGASNFQPLLNPILDEIESEGIAQLNRSELDLLASAHGLLVISGHVEEYIRAKRLLRPLASSISHLAASLSRQPGLSGLEGRIRIISSSDLLKAPLQSVDHFAGLGLPAHGRVFKHRGAARVVDDVPDSCVLVVEDGACFVHGLVLGRIACSDDCCIRESVAGIVVSSRGDIRARTILNRARVVATSGSVHATRAEDPDLVFAGDTLTIEGDARLGTYAAPTIEIGGVAHSGDYSFSKSLRADRFAPVGARDLTIHLCKTISFESYGGLVDPEASEILAELARLRQEIQNQKTLLAVSAHECEQYANNAITYLVTGESHSQQIDDLNRAHRRLAFLDRVVAAIESLTSASERQLAAGSRAQVDSDSPGLTHSDLEKVLDVQKGLPRFEVEGTDDDDLTKESEELRALSKKIRDVDSGTPAILIRLHEKKVNWLLERGTLLDMIRKKERVLKEITDSSGTLEKKNERVSRVQILSRLLASTDDRPANDPIRARAQSRFIQIILNTIRGRRDRLKKYKSDLDSLKLEYEESAKTLTEKFRLPAPGPDLESATTPEVTGRFEDGVTLYTERYLLNVTSAPANSVLVTKDCGDQPKTFRRLGNLVIEAHETATSAR